MVRKKPSQILDYHKLTAHKLHVLYEHFKNLKKKHLTWDKVFIGKHHDNEDENLERQLCLNGFPFNYYSNSTFPLPILLACNKNKNAIVYYNYQGRSLTDKELSSIFRASMICRLGVRVPIVLGNFSPTFTLVDLFDIRFYVERVEIDFVVLTKKQLDSLVPKSLRGFYNEHNSKYYLDTKVRLAFYEKMHEILARYKMQLFLVSESPQQAKVMKSKGLKLANR